MCDAAGLPARRRAAAAPGPLLHSEKSDPVTKAMMGAAVDAVAGQSGLTTKQAVLEILVGKMGLGAEWAAANMSRLQDRVGSAVRRQAAGKRKRDAQPGGAAAEEEPLLPQSEGGGGGCGGGGGLRFSATHLTSALGAFVSIDARCKF